MDITLGLDFGTHQSKLCMSYMPNNETIYEFVEFNLADGSKSVLFPSLIQINNDDTIRIGSIDYSTCATRPVPPPERPTLPERPDIDLPEEPDLILPPEPQRPSSQGNYESDKRQRKKYHKKHKIWESRCQDIIRAHRIWENKCNYLNNQLKKWQEEVDEINAEYDEEYAYWQRHQTEYRVLRYFKQAAFTSTLKWSSEEIPADTLCIWYLTYLLLYVRRYVKERFNEVFEESVSVQMGVPSGLNDNASRMIHYRGQRYLVEARHLMESFESHEDMCSVPYQTLVEMTKPTENNIIEEAEMYGFVIIPEAYAGLQSLTYSRRLSRGNMHLLVDIGGGTTDIAFFTIEKSLLPSIHTVTSFHKGLNYVLEKYLEEYPDCTMGEAQDLIRQKPSMFQRAITAYTSELRAELNYIIEHVSREFNKEVVGTELTTARLYEAMMGRPIVYCGGGAVFNDMRIAHHYFSDKRLINKDTLNIPNLMNQGIDKVLYTILATAYGLSIPTFEEIKTMDARQLWKTVAENARGTTPRHEKKDYGINDD